MVVALVVAGFPVAGFEVLLAERVSFDSPFRPEVSWSCILPGCSDLVLVSGRLVVRPYFSICRRSLVVVVTWLLVRGCEKVVQG